MSDAAASAMASEVTSAAIEPIAATQLWCTTCRGPKPFWNKPMAEGSRQRRPGWHGEHLVCRGCTTTIVTLYVEEAVVDG